MVQSCEEGNWLAFLTGWVTILAGLSAAGLIIQAFGRQAAVLLEAIIRMVCTCFSDCSWNFAVSRWIQASS